MQSTMSKQQLSNRDEIKVLNTLLSKAACHVTTTAKDNVWSVKVSTPEFRHLDTGCQSLHWTY